MVKKFLNEYGGYMRPHKKKFHPKLDKKMAERHIQEFTSDDKVLMALYFYESLSINEIANILHKNPETIQLRLDSMMSSLLTSSSLSNETNMHSTEILG